MVELGGKVSLYLVSVSADSLKLKTGQMPAIIKAGVEKKAQKVLAKKLQEAKDLGIYHPTMKKQFVDEKTKLKLEGEKKNAKKGRGLKGSIGKYKNGILHIDKKDIEAASQKSKAGGSFHGAVRFLDRSGGRKKSSGGSKKFKKKHH